MHIDITHRRSSQLEFVKTPDSMRDEKETKGPDSHYPLLAQPVGHLSRRVEVTTLCGWALLAGLRAGWQKGLSHFSS